MTVLQFVLQWSFSILLLATGYRVLQIAGMLKASRASYLIQRSGYILIIFAIARIIAVLYESFAGWSFFYLSKAVNDLFVLIIYLFTEIQYRIIRSPLMGDGGRARIIEAIDANLLDMQEKRRNLFQIIKLPPDIHVSK
jgi:hypothetical protein